MEGRPPLVYLFRNTSGPWDRNRESYELRKWWHLSCSLGKTLASILGEKPIEKLELGQEKWLKGWHRIDFYQLCSLQRVRFAIESSPTAIPNQGYDGTRSTFLLALQYMPAQSPVVLVVIGLEGLSDAIDGRKNLIDSFHSLRFVLSNCWEIRTVVSSRAEIIWTYTDWNELHMGRCWALIDLAILCGRESPS